MDPDGTSAWQVQPGAQQEFHELRHGGQELCMRFAHSRIEMEMISTSEALPGVQIHRLNDDGPNKAQGINTNVFASGSGDGFLEIVGVPLDAHLDLADPADARGAFVDHLRADKLMGFTLSDQSDDVGAFADHRRADESRAFTLNDQTDVQDFVDYLASPDRQVPFTESGAASWLDIQGAAANKWRSDPSSLAVNVNDLVVRTRITEAGRGPNPWSLSWDTHLAQVEGRLIDGRSSASGSEFEPMTLDVHMLPVHGATDPTASIASVEAALTLDPMPKAAIGDQSILNRNASVPFVETEPRPRLRFISRFDQDAVQLSSLVNSPTEPDDSDSALVGDREFRSRPVKIQAEIQLPDDSPGLNATTPVVEVDPFVWTVTARVDGKHDHGDRGVPREGSGGQDGDNGDDDRGGHGGGGGQGGGGGHDSGESGGRAGGDGPGIPPPVDFTTVVGPLNALEQLQQRWARLIGVLDADPPRILEPPSRISEDDGSRMLRLAEVRHPAGMTNQVASALTIALSDRGVTGVIVEPGGFFGPAAMGTAPASKPRQGWTITWKEERMRTLGAFHRRPRPEGIMGYNLALSWPPRIALIDSGDEWPATEHPIDLPEDALIDHEGHGTSVSALMRLINADVVVHCYPVFRHVDWASTLDVYAALGTAMFELPLCDLVALPLRLYPPVNEEPLWNSRGRSMAGILRDPEARRSPMVVCAAGNFENGQGSEMRLPATLPGVIVARGSDWSGNLAPYNCQPNGLDPVVVTAPGGEKGDPLGKMTCASDGYTENLYGTSFATAIVAASILL